MKNLTTTIALAVLMIACKKTEVNPVNNPAPAKETHGKVTVTVNSNFKYPELSIYRRNMFLNSAGSGTAKNTSYVWWNNKIVNYTHPVKYSYVINAFDTGNYTVRTTVAMLLGDSAHLAVDISQLWMSVKAVDQFGKVLIDTTCTQCNYINHTFNVK